MNKKEKITLIVGLLLIALVVLYFIFKNSYNESYIEKYINKNYPNYEVVEKNYEYLSHFWSTWYDTEMDDPNKDIICNTTIQNKDTNMYITIPFYHPKYGLYRASQYRKKDMKKMVSEFEKYYSSINEIKDKYNIALKISEVTLTEASNGDIFSMIIYIKQNDTIDMYKVIDEIDSIKTTLDIKEMHFIIAKDYVFNDLSPYRESNYLIVTIDNMTKVNEEDNYNVSDVYKSSNSGTSKWKTNYYRMNIQ